MKIAPMERRLDCALPAETVDRKIRGLSPAPGAFTFGNGTVAVLEVRAEGKKTMNAAEWGRGARIQVGDLFEYGS